MFKVGDWVQITPTPDLSWNQWRTSQDIYKDFLDRIGSIENISEDDERSGEYLYAVRVNFPNGLGHMGPGHYYEWFRADHLVRSSQSNAKLRDNMIQAGRELQEWEKFKKKSTDDILRKIFAKEPETIKQTDNKQQSNKQDDPNQWDIKKYEDDYSGYTFEYTNNTDVDYSYLTDISDVDSDDKD